MVPLLAKEAEKRKGTRTDISGKSGDRSASVPDGTEVPTGRSRKVVAKALLRLRVRG